MKHLAIIQKEFIKYSVRKIAVGWDDLSYDAQKQYLHDHPNSQRRITVKPGRNGLSLRDLKQQLENRLQVLTPGKGWQTI